MRASPYKPQLTTTMPGRVEERFESVMPIELDRGRGETRNVSASGIYFVTDVELVKGLVEGTPVSFTLRFKPASGGPFLLRGEARVVRLELLDGKVGVGAAISRYELERSD